MGAAAKILRVAVALALAASTAVAAAGPGHAVTTTGAAVDTGGGPLNVRSGPATDKRVVGTLDHGSALSVSCKVRGERISGHVRTSPTWLRVGDDRWVSNAYVAWDGRADLTWCSTAKFKPTSSKVATGGVPLNVRAAAAYTSERVGTYPDGTAVTVKCQVWGQEVDGRVSKTSVWYRLAPRRHVSAAYVKWSAGHPWLPWCGQDPPSVPPAGSDAFIDAHAGAARAGARATGVPASVTLAQAILETGWGKSALAREDHNLFGMKCFGSPGRYAIGCRDYGTFECSPTGGCFDVEATFRAYDNVRDSYRDHGALLSGWSRYAKAMEHRHDPDRFAREIHRAGYATDPHYSDKLIGIMQKYDLYRLDS